MADLKEAVGTVLEGWTLPHDVRKILETAYYADTPTPVQADHSEQALDMVKAEQSLEVVADLSINREAGFDLLLTDTIAGKCLRDGYYQLTDHAKATAALAQKDEEIAELKLEISVSDKLQRERLATLRSKLAGVDGLVYAFRKAVSDYGKPGGPWNVSSEPGDWITMAKEALATYEAAQVEKPTPE